MSLVHFLVTLFLIQYLRNTVQPTVRFPEWNRYLIWARFVAIGLLSAEAILSDSTLAGQALQWLWHLFLLLLLVIPYRMPECRPARPLLLAVVPFLALSISEDGLQLMFPAVYESIEDYVEAATVFAVILIFIMWLSFRKQQKALEVERLKREEEEKHNRLITAQNTDLERLVAERTAEITKQKEELQTALIELQVTQEQLVQREKLASLGELTAGIAHEIQNPLNFVNNFSEVSIELFEELQEERQKENRDAELEDDLLNDIAQNLQKIAQHGRRADVIVKGMLQHSRSNVGQKEPTNLNALAEEYLRLSYHGLRAKDKSFNAELVTQLDPDLPKLTIVPQDIGRVLLNLFNNAFYAVKDRAAQAPADYRPTVTLRTEQLADGAVVRISDNGAGVPDAIREKIFQPFFTTKPAGQGTGLGLSLSYDIVTKGHGGEMSVTSKQGEGATFVVQLPIG